MASILIIMETYFTKQEHNLLLMKVNSARLQHQDSGGSWSAVRPDKYVGLNSGNPDTTNKNVWEKRVRKTIRRHGVQDQNF